MITLSKDSNNYLISNHLNHWFGKNHWISSQNPIYTATLWTPINLKNLPAVRFLGSKSQEPPLHYVLFTMCCFLVLCKDVRVHPLHGSEHANMPCCTLETSHLLRWETITQGVTEVCPNQLSLGALGPPFPKRLKEHGRSMAGSSQHVWSQSLWDMV